ncbi:MAG: hypothetical protein WCL49_07520 [bacterium]
MKTCTLDGKWTLAQAGAVNSSGRDSSITWKEYGVLFDDLLGKVVRELAPQTACWPPLPALDLKRPARAGRWLK